MSDSATFTQLEVERATGLSREVLRKWELRYHFPLPQRGARGQRLYSAADVERLQWIQRLIRTGKRPGSLLNLPLQDLQALLSAQTCPTDAEAADPKLVDRVLQTLQPDAALPALPQALQGLIDQAGLGHFARVLLPALNGAVGAAWAAGVLPVHGEHRYTETVRNVLQEAFARLPVNPRLPRMVLTTPPPELHGLGLMSVQAVFALEGVQCIALGTQTPANEVALAAQAYSARVVALSVSICAVTETVNTYLEQLRSALPKDCVVWVGGQGAKSLDRMPGVLVFEDVRQALRAWKVEHG